MFDIKFKNNLFNLIQQNEQRGCVNATILTSSHADAASVIAHFEMLARTRNETIDYSFVKATKPDARDENLSVR